MSQRAIRGHAAAAWIFSLLLGTFVPSALAEPKLIAEQEIAGWTLRVIADDSSDYATCSIDRSGRDLFLFGVTVERPTRWRYLTLSSLGDEEPFQNGAAYSVTYSIDDQEPVTVRAQGAGSRSVLIPLSDTLAESLRRGSLIAFHARQGGAATFSLSGSARALAALEDCVTRHLGYEAETPTGPVDDESVAISNPFSSTGADEASHFDPAVSVAQMLENAVVTAGSPVEEARLVGETFLREAHLLDDARILEEQSADRIDGYDVTWILPKARIAFAVVNDIAPTSADAMLDGMAGALQEACSNRAQIDRPDGSAPEVLGRLHVYCNGAPSALFALFIRPHGGMYLMTVKGDRGSDGLSASQRYDDQISDVWIRNASQ